LLASGAKALHNQSVALISSSDQERLRESFSAMTRRVRLLFFTQTLDCEMCPETRQILDELPPLSDKIAIEEVNLILDGEKARSYGVDRAPSIAVTYAETAPDSAPANGHDGDGWIDSRIRFLGAPAGYEFIALVQAVLIAGGQPLRLSEESRLRLQAVNRPITMQVFTTPT
jgi:alkyl hydroperoxide reductase subunit AhpF